MHLLGSYKWAVCYIEIANEWFFACGELHSEVSYMITFWKVEFV